MAMNRKNWVLVGAAGALVVSAGLAGCGSTSNTAAPNANPNLNTSQDGTSSDTSVYNPFYLIGSNYAANSTVTVNIFVSGQKTNPVFTSDAPISSTGTLKYLVNSDIKAGSYDAYTMNKTTQLAKQSFTDLGPRSGSVTHVTSGGAGQFISPAIRGGNLYMAQSKSGGQIYRFQTGNLPNKPSATPVEVKADGVWTPNIAANVKMEQISFDNDNKNMYITKKAMNANALGGNSVWTYPFANNQTTGAGTNLAGISDSNQGDGYYAWGPNPSSASIAAYNKGHFPTTTPTKSAIGNGGGVAQVSTKNGNLYFGSLQSGCVYKQNQTSKQTSVVYCIPSLGANNQNQSVYSLDNDNNGLIYAIYQGSTDNNTIVLRITPNGDGVDKVEAIQLAGFARSVGLAVNKDGSRLFATGVPMAQYNTNNTNSILQIDNPTWGSTEKPTQVAPIAITLPGSAEQVWLNGLNLVDKNGNKGDRVYVADNINGFWILYL